VTSGIVCKTFNASSPVRSGLPVVWNNSFAAAADDDDVA